MSLIPMSRINDACCFNPSLKAKRGSLLMRLKKKIMQKTATRLCLCNNLNYRYEIRISIFS